ncbi:DNA-directed RNA polymerase subunit delta [Lentibacillus salinarum]|uniref:Probable DNA-directed RNA polymerase subunit delta n=1 Tax=Lentibacillus salinarum TaxID=446820 RepID=A0ABW3ZT99_9BACI
MSLQNYSREELEVTSLLELAHALLSDEKKAFNFNQLYDKVTELKGFTDELKQTYIAQFYTDLTIDGRFLTTSPGIWGLKRWYPVEQMDEVAAATPKKKKTKAKKKKNETVPREEPEEGEPDVPDDNVEVLTGTFEDEVLSEDELEANPGFDDEADDVDEFDDDEEEADDAKAEEGKEDDN